ncbi:MAG: Na+/H+ antiporter NhaA [Rhodospirillales bacterium]|nr:Na+/H+ antiporter NhaA [Rhodospirillales bacterium]
MPLTWLREFLRLEAASGIVLIFAAAAALIFANSPLGDYYFEFLKIPGSVQVGQLEIAKPLLLWVNDLWMAVFFFLIGLEIKRELLEGELSTRADLLLPTAAAVGGMAVPALIYVLLNWDNPVNLNGWAIPAATDIAFALGILALLGSRVPLSLKVLLTAIAIIDDLGAIVVIAIFYTANMSLVSLGLAGLAILGLVLLNVFRVSHVAAYLIVGTILWVCVLKSGVHATLAGVVTAFAIPLKVEDEEGHSLLRHLEHLLHPWVAFLILPMFAFANAGISFEGISLASFLEPVTLGIALGLIVGKQLGVFLPLWLCIKSGIAPMPKNASWVQLYAVSMLCGIGFTMSLFIGGLAFELSDFKAPVRLGVLTGSIVSAVLGYALLRFSPEKPAQETPS